MLHIVENNYVRLLKSVLWLAKPQMPLFTLAKWDLVIVGRCFPCLSALDNFTLCLLLDALHWQLHCKKRKTVNLFLQCYFRSFFCKNQPLF